MQIDWTTLALQTINALVLIWLLSRFLFKPVAQIIAERQKTACALMASADQAKRAAVSERDAAARETQQLVAARSDALKKVEAEAGDEKAALLAAAQADVAGLRAAASADIQAARVEQDRLAARRATQLAVEIASKLLARLPEGICMQGFIDGLVDGVTQLADAVRMQLGADGGTLTLAAARTLSPGEQAQCRAALERCLQRKVTLEFDVDPRLIAGLELRAPHAVVRNNFGADLTRVSAALLDGDHVPT